MTNTLPRGWEYNFHSPDVDPINSLEWFRRIFLYRRKNLAKKLQNPKLEK
jgi:hypothetical protein